MECVRLVAALDCGGAALAEMPVVSASRTIANLKSPSGAPRIEPEGFPAKDDSQDNHLQAHRRGSSCKMARGHPLRGYISEKFPLDIQNPNHYIKGSSLNDPQYIVDVSKKCL